MYQSILVVCSLALGQTQLPPEDVSPIPVVIPTQHCAPICCTPNPCHPCCKHACDICQESGDRFFCRFIKAYCEYLPKDEKKKDDPCKSECDNGNGSGNSNGCDDPCKPAGSPRRALPPPFPSPPFPTGEWQGFPLVGIPPSDTVYPFMKAVYGTPWGDAIKDSRIKFYGWATASGNWSTANNSNTVTSYWVDPNALNLDQLLVRLEREVDSAQTDRMDWGFRSTGFYGIDYRYTIAGGWGSDQILVNNLLYGFDPTEQFVNLYIPNIAQGVIITAGRWVATPDIEVQFAPDNYMGSHSLLFTIDIYTQTGLMATVMLNKQWTVQAAIHAGADMAPWYEGAVPTGMFGIRWVSQDNCDSVYTVLNAINDSEFQYFDLNGVPAGHHNYNIVQSTWQHKFSDNVHTKTEAYYMWEMNAPVGGTPSIGPFQFNTGGGLGPTVPGLSRTYAALNYTMFKVSDKDFFTVRNEWTKDENGTRYGFPGNYSGHALGFCHNFSPVFQVRPEIGYYRSYNSTAFDNGARSDLWLYGFDMTLRF